MHPIPPRRRTTTPPSGWGPRALPDGRLGAQKRLLLVMLVNHLKIGIYFFASPKQHLDSSPALGVIGPPLNCPLQGTGNRSGTKLRKDPGRTRMQRRGCAARGEALGPQLRAAPRRRAIDLATRRVAVKGLKGKRGSLRRLIVPWLLWSELRSGFASPCLVVLYTSHWPATPVSRLALDHQEFYIDCRGGRDHDWKQGETAPWTLFQTASSSRLARGQPW
jgi:hypothetical protein